MTASNVHHTQSRNREAAAIRAIMKLCYNTDEQSWQVYTVKLPANEPCWILISNETRLWYIERFNPPIILYTADCKIKEVPDVPDILNS